jgi:hypothetical protein
MDPGPQHQDDIAKVVRDLGSHFVVAVCLSFVVFVVVIVATRGAAHSLSQFAFGFVFLVFATFLSFKFALVSLTVCAVGAVAYAMVRAGALRVGVLFLVITALWVFGTYFSSQSLVI